MPTPSCRAGKSKGSLIDDVGPWKDPSILALVEAGKHGRGGQQAQPACANPLRAARAGRLLLTRTARCVWHCEEPLLFCRACVPADIARREGLTSVGEDGALTGDSMDLEGGSGTGASVPPSPLAAQQGAQPSASAARRQSSGEAAQQAAGEASGEGGPRWKCCLCLCRSQLPLLDCLATAVTCSPSRAGPHLPGAAAGAATGQPSRHLSAPESPFEKFGAGAFQPPAGLLTCVAVADAAPLVAGAQQRVHGAAACAHATHPVLPWPASCFRPRLLPTLTPPSLPVCPALHGSPARPPCFGSTRLLPCPPCPALLFTHQLPRPAPLRPAPPRSSDSEMDDFQDARSRRQSILSTSGSSTCEQGCGWGTGRGY